MFPYCIFIAFIKLRVFYNSRKQKTEIKELELLNRRKSRTPEVDIVVAVVVIKCLVGHFVVVAVVVVAVVCQFWALLLFVFFVCFNCFSKVFFND